MAVESRYSKFQWCVSCLPDAIQIYYKYDLNNRGKATDLGKTVF